MPSQKVKGSIYSFASCLAWLLRLCPFFLRRAFYSGALLVESRIGQPESSLKRLFLLYDDLGKIIDERSIAYEGGIHPKHRMTNYHDFFVTNIASKSKVIDIGCGVGAVARSIASTSSDILVLGIDIDADQINIARKSENPANLEFAVGDILTMIRPDFMDFDVVVLSNVLEHIEDRSTFLKTISKKISPIKMLIRVPLFERHWHLPLRKELGINYFSDATHYTEHSLDEFTSEIQIAGLSVHTLQIAWGEIWAVCLPMESSCQK